MDKNTVCRSEALIITNNSENATNYTWNLCSGDIENLASASSITSVSLASNVFDMSDILSTNENTHAFMVSSANNRIIRVDDLYSVSAPTYSNLGNIVSNGRAIDVIEHNGIWKGIVASSDGTIFRLNFGNNITSIPSVETLSGLTSIGNIRGLKIVRDGENFYVLIVGGSTLQVIEFIEDIESETYDELVTNVSGATNINDIDVFKECENWKGIIATYNSGTFQVDFSEDLLSAPSTSSIPSSPNTGGISILYEAENYYAFSTDENSLNLLRLDFGNSLSNEPTFVDLGDYSINLSTALKMHVVNGQVTGFVMGFLGNDLTKLSFEKTCVLNSTVENPIDITWNESGTYELTLIARDDEENVNSSSQIITITSNFAPPISFTDNTNECLGQANTFTPSDMGLASYEWSFDNGTTIGSTNISPSHTFSQTGDSIVVLTVNDGVCSNFVKDTIPIYPVPVAPTFSTPDAPYCTGADLAFENLFDESNYNGATLTYDWNYNGEGSSSERDGSFAFDSEGTKTISVTASIPGCSTPSAGTDIDVIAGPDVNFSFEDLCVGNDTQFTNGTTGSGITGQTWDFGDGSETSSVSSPSHTYEDHGTYNVTLTVNNNQGCSNELILPVPIDDKPVAAFNQGPACEGIDISFIDQSSVEGLANITDYDWDFDGLGTSTDKKPTFNFENQGMYDVELIVQTTAGCSDTIVNAVNVQLAPEAAFDVNIGCINSETFFLDQSEGDFSNPITQWIWTIDGSLASYSSSFGEVYNEPGDHTVSLLVRSANSCQAVQNDNFTIGELPIADFTIEKNCDNEQTIFQDATISSSTTIKSFSWQFGNEGSGNTNPATHQFSNAGSYSVSLNIVDEVGCEGSVEKKVTIHPSPEALIGANTDIGPAPLTIDFTDETQNSHASMWFFGDEEESTSVEKSPQFTYGTEGDYNAQLIATNDLGCSDTVSMPITVADPILDLELVQISTEESEDQTNISLTVKNSGNVILHGFDIRINLDNKSSIFESYPGSLTRGETIIYPLNFTFSSIANNIGYACIRLIDRNEEFEDINIVNNEGCIDFNQQLVVEDSYPNPVTSSDAEIRLNMILPADGPVQLFLLNATGSILYQETYMDANAGLNSFFIDIHSFKKGVYFIKSVYDQKTSTQRFIKL
ncbi:PKD domain-containing protein [Reichenbachiella sp.]|uniref:PKD domain-containing protein n=1 Tax=Reichenbachiella sp. TaxID=2184521 RepID=UPI003B59276D